MTRRREALAALREAWPLAAPEDRAEVARLASGSFFVRPALAHDFTYATDFSGMSGQAQAPTGHATQQMELLQLFAEDRLPSEGPMSLTRLQQQQGQTWPCGHGEPSLLRPSLRPNH